METIGRDTIGIEGVMRFYQLPTDWTDEELRYWWEPETELGKDGLYHIIRSSRMGPEEKERRRILTASNLLTNSGITQLLNNIAVTGQGSMQAFFQILSLGNGAITGVARTDTAVAGDAFTTGARKVPASFTSVGFATTVTTNLGSGDAVGTLTNGGIYGFNPSGGTNATTTIGTGLLLSHILFSYTKGASPIAITYTLTISN